MSEAGTGMKVANPSAPESPERSLIWQYDGAPNLAGLVGILGAVLGECATGFWDDFGRDAARAPLLAADAADGGGEADAGEGRRLFGLSAWAMLFGADPAELARSGAATENAMRRALALWLLQNRSGRSVPEIAAILKAAFPEANKRFLVYDGGVPRSPAADPPAGASGGDDDDWDDGATRVGSGTVEVALEDSSTQVAFGRGDTGCALFEMDPQDYENSSSYGPEAVFARLFGTTPPRVVAEGVEVDAAWKMLTLFEVADGVPWNGGLYCALRGRGGWYFRADAEGGAAGYNGGGARPAAGGTAGVSHDGPMTERIVPALNGWDMGEDEAALMTLPWFFPRPAGVLLLGGLDGRCAAGSTVTLHLHGGGHGSFLSGGEEFAVEVPWGGTATVGTGDDYGLAPADTADYYYVFAGWAERKSGESPSYGPGDVKYTGEGGGNEVRLVEDAHLVAVWSEHEAQAAPAAQTATVVFSGDNRQKTKGETHKQVVAAGTATALSNSYFKSLYGLARTGWAKSVAGAKAYDNGQNVTLGAGRTLTLYPVYAADAGTTYTYAQARAGSKDERRILGAQNGSTGGSASLAVPVPAGYAELSVKVEVTAGFKVITSGGSAQVSVGGKALWAAKQRVDYETYDGLDQLPFTLKTAKLTLTRANAKSAFKVAVAYTAYGNSLHNKYVDFRAWVSKVTMA